MKKQILALKIHLTELKIKGFYLILSFLITFLICFYFRWNIYITIAQVFIQLHKNFIFTKMTTGFVVYFKLAFWVSFVFITPLLIYFIFLFLLKIVYNYQIKIWRVFLPLFFLIIFIIINNFYYQIYPIIVIFFLKFENSTELLSVTLEARIDQYLSFFFTFIGFTLFLFFFPLTFLTWSIFVKKTQINYNNLRKKLYSMSFLVFIIMAPPDFFIQLLLLPPFFIFSEIILFISITLKIYLKNINEESRIRTYDEI